MKMFFAILSLCVLAGCAHHGKKCSGKEGECSMEHKKECGCKTEEMKKDSKAP